MMASGDEEVAAQAVPSPPSCSLVVSVPPVSASVPSDSPVTSEVTVPQFPVSPVVSQVPQVPVFSPSVASPPAPASAAQS